MSKQNEYARDRKRRANIDKLHAAETESVEREARQAANECA